jgi:hypothetical protein
VKEEDANQSSLNPAHCLGVVLSLLSIHFDSSFESEISKCPFPLGWCISILPYLQIYAQEKYKYTQAPSTCITPLHLC